MAEPLEVLIPKTQEQLQPLVAKPKLADKLLSKPPFRFLHDVFAAVTQSTGFAKGLYNAFEADSSNLKEKHHKTAYLDKMIVCVSQTLGREIDVRSAKVVAGLEPENTNLLLQALAQAAGNSSLDWAKAVEVALTKVPSLTADGAPAPAETKSEAPVPTERPASKERPADPDKAAAEAKARDKAKKEEAERRAESQRREAEAKAAAEAVVPAAESKGGGSGSNSRASSSSSSRAAKQPQPDNNSDNNQVDEALLQSIKECNGDVERTKDMIEKVISKPKMSAKLLSKPPFRFLHDIVSEITRTTGFAEGLYSGEELDSGAIKEKQPKMDYLTKIMLCVSCQLNVEVDAKAAKIVAGLEPDDTNKFLQLLALACRVGSSSEAVQRVLSGDTALRPGGAAKGVGAGSAPPAAKAPVEQREATPEAKLSSRSSTPQETKKRREPAEEKPKQDSTPQAAPGSFSGPMKPLAVTSGGADDEDNSNLNFGARDGDNGDVGNAPSTSGGLGTSRTSRPTTARRRPPKLKENVTEVGRLLVHDTKVAPVVGIMKDGDNNDSDDEAGGDGDDNNSRHASMALDGAAGGAHGRLVRDILKDQNAEEEQARKQKEEEEQANEAETGIRLGRRKKSLKERSKSTASSLSEMTELRNSIQKICQAANPVGKGIEFVHEDLDAMTKELEFWKKEYLSKRDAYEDEKKKTDEALQPLQLQLVEVDEQIKEQIHKINSLKATIAKNEEKTQKLLRMVVSA